MSLYRDSELLLAVTKRKLNAVKYYLRTGADVNARGGTPLVIAVEEEDLTMVRYLYSEGARSDDALTTALDCGHEEIAEFLLDMRSSVSTPKTERLRFLVSSLGGMWRLVAKYS